MSRRALVADVLLAVWVGVAGFVYLRQFAPQGLLLVRSLLGAH